MYAGSAIGDKMRKILLFATFWLWNKWYKRKTSTYIETISFNSKNCAGVCTDEAAVKIQET